MPVPCEHGTPTEKNPRWIRCAIGVHGAVAHIGVCRKCDGHAHEHVVVLRPADGATCPLAVRDCCGQPWRCSATGGECSDHFRLECDRRP